MPLQKVLYHVPNSAKICTLSKYRVSLKKRSFGIPAPLEARVVPKGWISVKNIVKHIFLVVCNTFNPIAHFGIPSVGLREGEIPSKQPLASAAAFKVRLLYRTVLTQGVKLINNPSSLLQNSSFGVFTVDIVNIWRGLTMFWPLEQPRASSGAGIPKERF